MPTGPWMALDDAIMGARFQKFVNLRNDQRSKRKSTHKEVWVYRSSVREAF